MLCHKWIVAVFEEGGDLGLKDKLFDQEVLSFS